MNEMLHASTVNCLTGWCDQVLQSLHHGLLLKVDGVASSAGILDSLEVV